MLFSLSLDTELKNIGAGIMPGDIEGKTFFRHTVSLDGCRDQLLFAVYRFNNVGAIGAYDRAAAIEQNLGLTAQLIPQLVLFG